LKKNLPLIKERFTTNLLYKFVALIVALSIWVATLQGRKDFTRIRNVDLQFILKPNLVVTNLDKLSVKLQVSGSRLSLNKLNHSAQPLTLNLIDVGAGHKIIDLKPSDFTLPVGVKLVSISPNQLDLDIKEVAKR
jgi:hypothetical protein